MSKIQGCGSATHFHGCCTKKKSKKTCSHLVTCRTVAPAGIEPGETKFVLAYYTKFRSHAPDSNMDSCFLASFFLCNPLFFLLYSVKQILPLTLVVALRSSLPGNARY